MADAGQWKIGQLAKITVDDLNAEFGSLTYEVLAAWLPYGSLRPGWFALDDSGKWWWDVPAERVRLQQVVALDGNESAAEQEHTPTVVARRPFNLIDCHNEIERLETMNARYAALLRRIVAAEDVVAKLLTLPLARPKDGDRIA